MRSKPAVNTQRASAANKPFMTEYRLAYRDPTATVQKRKNATTRVLSRKGKSQSKPVEHAREPILPPVVKAEEVRLLNYPFTDFLKKAVETPHLTTSLTLPAMMNGNAHANVSLEAYRRRRRLLAAEHKQGLHQRYNIITGMYLYSILCNAGSAIDGELSSGFKEGRRAVCPTFSHIDTITNVCVVCNHYSSNRLDLLDTTSSRAMTFSQERLRKKSKRFTET